MSNEIEPAGRKLLLWNPKPINKPELDPDLLDHSPLVRTSEILRHSFHRFEFWLSANGMLREWLRLNLLLALIVGITGLLVAPSVTILLGEIAQWVQLILDILAGLVSTALLAIFGFILLRVLAGIKNQFSRDHH